jgi:UDP-GlcNAc:undecaprenyl-phosphate/decaprenyl-phosphate GlcNAc-1-phosphate transferase
MVREESISLQLLLLVPAYLPNWAILLIGGACALILSYLLTYVVRAFCHTIGWLDHPAARRVHEKAVPRLGGVAMFTAFVIASLLFYRPGPRSNPNEIVIYWLLIVGAGMMVIVHAYDDVKGLGPLPKLLAQTFVVLVILGPWGGTFHGILLFTFNNPFGQEFTSPALPWYQQPTLFLFIHDNVIRFAAIPAVILTWFWAVGMMNTVNLIDGLDGLATGVVTVAAFFITLISWILGQHSIAILSAIFTGATLGFLPHNWNPAKIFMGDSGSMFLGLGLAVLSIMGGAKLALALLVLGVPILDVAVVMFNRLQRGQSPLHYDKTHLHHRLMATGLSARQICYVLYGLSLVFGLLALGLSGMNSAHFYKFVGVGAVGLTMVILILWIEYRTRKQKRRTNLANFEAELESGKAEVAGEDIRITGAEKELVRPGKWRL